MTTVRCQVKPSVRGFIDFQNYFRDTSENVWQPMCNSIPFIPPPQRKTLSRSLPPKAGGRGHSKGRLGWYPHQQWFKHQKMTTVGLLGALQEWLPGIALTTQHFRTEVELQRDLWGGGGQGQSEHEYPLFIMPEEGTSLPPVYKRMANNLNSSGRRKLNERYSVMKPMSQSRPQSRGPLWVQDCPLGDISECHFGGLLQWLAFSAQRVRRLPLSCSAQSDSPTCWNTNLMSCWLLT